jgi:hypothetical protein
MPHSNSRRGVSALALSKTEKGTILRPVTSGEPDTCSTARQLRTVSHDVRVVLEAQDPKQGCVEGLAHNPRPRKGAGLLLVLPKPRRDRTAAAGGVPDLLCGRHVGAVVQRQHELGGVIVRRDALLIVHVQPRPRLRACERTRGRHRTRPGSTHAPACACAACWLALSRRYAIARRGHCQSGRRGQDVGQRGARRCGWRTWLVLLAPGLKAAPLKTTTSPGATFAPSGLVR